ncbi:MAG: aromatic amino acid lyase [Boseongicola sp.]
MLHLDGQSLTIEILAENVFANDILLDEDGRARMAASRALIDKVIADGTPVYGVTTGLGARSVEALSHDALEDFSLQTLRGRAHAIGEDDSPENVRAGLIVRLNTLLRGHSGARPEVADHIAACLNAGLSPVVGKLGSIGVADLVINATAGLALAGEGKIQAGDEIGDAGDMMRAVGIEPLKLAPRDGLALASHSGAVAGTAALAFSAAQNALFSAQSAAALSLEAFRANLSPLDPRALAIKPLPGQQLAADDLVRRLEGSRLFQPGEARRLQDPLSFRNIPQIHGGVFLALSKARTVIEIEMNSSSDNPVAIFEAGEILSCGNYMTIELGLVCEWVNRAIVLLASAQVARITKLMDPRLSDLPLSLAKQATNSNGLGPLAKPAEAILNEISQVAQSSPVWPGASALGIEDSMTTAPVAVRSLSKIADLLNYLTAIELLVAVQAIELRDREGALGSQLADCAKTLRSLSAPMTEDRALSDDIKRVSQAISRGDFS